MLHMFLSWLTLFLFSEIKVKAVVLQGLQENETLPEPDQNKWSVMPVRELASKFTFCSSSLNNFSAIVQENYHVYLNVYLQYY